MFYTLVLAGLLPSTGTTVALLILLIELELLLLPW